MRLASVVVSFAVLLGACSESTFSSTPSDAGGASSDGSLADGSGNSEAGAASTVGLRDFNSTSGDLTTDGGDTAIVVQMPSGAQPSDVVFAVIGLYAVGDDVGTSIAAPSGWQSYVNDNHGGNASFQWHVFAFATQVASSGQTATFTVHGFVPGINATRWYAELIAYSGASVHVDLKDNDDTENAFPYVSFPSVIATKGSRVLAGMLTDLALPTPLLGLPPDVTEIGSGFLSGHGRFTDRPAPAETSFPSYTIPTGPDDAGPPPSIFSSTFQFVISPAN